MSESRCIGGDVEILAPRWRIAVALVVILGKQF